MSSSDRRASADDAARDGAEFVRRFLPTSPFVGHLGMQLVDKSRSTLAFRMDDRKQRVVVHEDGGEGPAFYGWEVADAAALHAVASQVERAGVAVAMSPAAIGETMQQIYKE